MSFFAADLTSDDRALLARIAAGKSAGLVFGLVGFFTLPYFAPEAGWLFRWGVLLWYPTVGAFIALAAGHPRHPLLNWTMPAWLLGLWIGAWMNFVLIFFCYDAFVEMVRAVDRPAWMLSPFWLIPEGAAIGAIIGQIAKIAEARARRRRAAEPPRAV